MRILNFSLVVFVCASCLLGGCKLSDEDKETVIKVSPEFSLDLYEMLGSTRQFQIQVTTVDPQPCANDIIDYSSNKSDSRLFLSLHEIIPSSDCIPAETVIRTDASFGFLDDKKYEVEITLKDVVQNVGTLIVTPDSYTLNLETTDGLKLEHNVLQRVPKGYIWGYVAFSNKENSESAADGFLNELSGRTAEGLLKAGYYGHFIINENNQLVFVSPPEFNYFNTFYFKYDGSLTDLKTLVDTYRSSNNDAEFKIIVHTSDGKTI